MIYYQLVFINFYYACYELGLEVDDESSSVPTHANFSAVIIADSYDKEGNFCFLTFNNKLRYLEPGQSEIIFTKEDKKCNKDRYNARLYFFNPNHMNFYEINFPTEVMPFKKTYDIDSPGLLVSQGRYIIKMIGIDYIDYKLNTIDKVSGRSYEITFNKCPPNKRCYMVVLCEDDIGAVFTHINGFKHNCQRATLKSAGYDIRIDATTHWTVGDSYSFKSDYKINVPFGYLAQIKTKSSFAKYMRLYEKVYYYNGGKFEHIVLDFSVLNFFTVNKDEALAQIVFYREVSPIEKVYSNKNDKCLQGFSSDFLQFQFSSTSYRCRKDLENINYQAFFIPSYESWNMGIEQQYVVTKPKWNEKKELTYDINFIFPNERGNFFYFRDQTRLLGEIIFVETMHNVNLTINPNDGQNYIDLKRYFKNFLTEPEIKNFGKDFEFIPNKWHGQMWLKQTQTYPYIHAKIFSGVLDQDYYGAVSTFIKTMDEVVEIKFINIILVFIKDVYDEIEQYDNSIKTPTKERLGGFGSTSNTASNMIDRIFSGLKASGSVSLFGKINQNKEQPSLSNPIEIKDTPQQSRYELLSNKLIMERYNPQTNEIEAINNEDIKPIETYYTNKKFF